MSENKKIKNYLEGLNPEQISSLKEQGYYTEANNLFEKKEDKSFDNGEYAHALWGMYKLFEMAEHTIIIFSVKLKEKANNVDFYANTKFLEMVKSFLAKPDSSLNIISEEILSGSHPVVELSKENSFSDKISIKTLKKGKYDFNNHFIVADDVAYRYELKEIDGKTVKAEFNFNNKIAAETLTRIFNILQSGSE